MQDYDIPLYRPPSEGENLIIQATIGCSFNRCTFCSMYKSKTFRTPPLSTVLHAIDAAALSWPEAQRVFLADGDALTLPTEDLLSILTHLAKRLPKLTRVSCYATPANLLDKSLDELTRLRENKLSLIYFGIETGHGPLLKKTHKGASAAGMSEGLHKARSAAIKVSATLILGLGGMDGWQEHIDGSLDLLNQTPINYLSTLQLYLDPLIEQPFLTQFTPPFRPQNDAGILNEQHRLISGLNHPPHPIIFRSNHASNALALAGTLPKDQTKLLVMIQAAQQGTIRMRPMWARSM